MTERRETVSKNIENVICTMGTQSKKPNTVVMAITDDIIMDALSLYRDKKKSVERTEGLLRYELVAVYAEEGRTIDPDKEEHARLISERNGFSQPESVDAHPSEESTEQKIMDMTDELDEAVKGDEG